MKYQTNFFKRAAMYIALWLTLGTGSAQAIEIMVTQMDFYTPSATTPGFVDPITTGSFNTSNTGEIFKSGTDFFGQPWTATVQQAWDTPGTYTFSGTVPAGGKYPAPGTAYSFTFTLKANQYAVGTYFNWSVNTNIPVLAVFDCTNPAACTPVDTDGDGSPGTAMQTAPFPGQTPAFSGSVKAAFHVSLSGKQGGNNVVLVTKSGGNVTFTPTIFGVTGATTYDWSGSSAGLTGAAVGGTTNNTFVFNPSGLTNGTAYTVSAAITISGVGVVTKTATVTVEPAAALSSTKDSDGDGLVDNDPSEGYADSDGDGLPNYLDSSNNDASLLTLDSSASNNGSITTGSGSLKLGAKALDKSITNMLAGTAESGASITFSDIGVAESTGIKSSCVGGCVDFEITGLSNGATTKVVIPLTRALPDFPVYRKFVQNKWNGFQIDSKNKIWSAPALSTGPITCPAPGSSTYISGLIPGDFCVQLMLEDGGKNDADGIANGTILDPGGIGTSSEEILAADVPNGCSMSTVPVNPTQRADWWLVAGFFAALAWLRSMRRKSHAA